MQQSNKNLFRANRIFVDRIEPTRLINEACADILNEKYNKKVYDFYGYGGIGKSKFLEELQRNVKYKDEFNIIKINLNIYEYNNVMSILLAIRRSLDADCPEFDYGVIRYYNKCHLPFAQLNEQLKTAKSTMFSIVKESLTDCADVFIPGFSYFEKIANLFPKVKDYVKQIKDKKKYEYIDELTATDLLQQLPVYLAQGINAGKKKTLLIFDDYESMKNKLDGGSLCSSCDDWIFSFIQNVESGIFLFSSREKLGWKENKISDAIVEQYYLERLSDKDASEFLREVPIEDEGIIEDILNVAQGIPIYLDMCVDLYENYVKRNDYEFNIEDVDAESITNRYLAHLSTAQTELVHLISHLEIFDLDILKFFIRKLNLAIDEIELLKLLEKCIFNQLDEEDYKLDASIKKQILSLTEPNIAQGCISVLLAYLSEKSAVTLNNLIFYFESLCKLISKYGLESKKEQELFFVCINRTLDAGYWTSMDGLVEKYLTAEEYEHYKLYVHANKEKREGNLKGALEIAEKLVEQAKTFGNYRFAIQLLRTQIIHLLGNYDDAIKGYAEIVDKMELLDLETKDQKTYVLSQLKHADVNFLKGKFITSKKSLKSIEFDQDKNLEMEYMRIKGHIFRFNLDFENARDLYEQCYEECSVDKKAKGMLLNNLAEIYCIEKPELAIEYGNKSIEENGVLNANIEIGKTYSAISVAYARLGDYENALYYARESINLQGKIGYKSGVLFGYFALCYANYCKGDYESYCTALSNMKEVQSQIKTYPYVVTFAEYLYSGKWDDGEIDWLSDDMEDRVKKLLK